MGKDPLYRSRALRRNKVAKRFILYAAGLLFVCTGAVAFFYIPYFSLQSVFFEGIKTVNANDIQTHIDSFLSQKKWGLLPHTNFFIFLADADMLEQRIRSTAPKLKTFFIRKNFPHALTLIFTERKIWATLCSDGSCFYMDDGGFLFGQSSHISGSVFFAINDERHSSPAVGMQALPPDELLRIQTLLEKLTSITSDTFRTLALSGSENVISKYEAKTDGGWSVIFDSKTDSELAIANFISAYEGLLKKDMTTIDYIDLRLENKIFYKYRNN